MNAFPLVVASLLLTAGCAKQAAPPHGQAMLGSFFVGVDSSKLPEPARSAVTSAQKDIDLVLGGRPPSCKSEPDGAASDGGTALYKCKYYDLTVMQSIYQLGNVSGYIYGPIVNFPGDYPVSYVRFYSNEEFHSLTGSRDGR